MRRDKMDSILKKLDIDTAAEDTINMFLDVSGFVNYLVCIAFFVAKADYSHSGLRFTSALIGVTFINLCTSLICLNEWREGTLIKLMKYLGALSVFIQILLLMLTTNEWPEQFIRIMVLNILAYFPFVISFLNRLLEINKKKTPLIEFAGVVALAFVSVFDKTMHFDQLAIISSLSLLTLLQNLIIQTYYYINRRHNNE